MATDTPSGPPPSDDPNRPADRPAHGPDSAAEENWLVPDPPPVGEPDGSSLMFEELVPPTETNPEIDIPTSRLDLQPSTDEVIDLGEAIPTAELINPLPIDPDDALGGLPPTGSVAEGSGWIDVPPPADLPLTHPDSLAESDIFSGVGSPDSAGSDVIRTLGETDESGIFDGPLEGSGQFERPGGTTEDVRGAAAAEDAIDEGMALPSSHLFEGELPASPASSGSGVRFEDLDVSVGGSNLFADITDADIQLGGSGVNLLEPTGDHGSDAGSAKGPGSSIFDMNVEEGMSALAGRNRPPSSADDDRDILSAADDESGERAGTSHIFADATRAGSAADPAPSDVLYDLPVGDESALPEVTDGTGEEAKIDWSLPAGDDPLDLSRQLAVVPGEDTADGPGLSDLAGDGSDLKTPALPPPPPRKPRTAPAAPAEPPAARRTGPAKRPTEPRPVAAAADRKKGGGLATLLGGLALGLLIGAGGFAASYFSGAIPNGSESASTGASVDALRLALDAKTREVESAHKVADKANDDRKTADGRLARAQKDVTTATREVSTARQAAAKAAKDKLAVDQALGETKADLAAKTRALNEATAKVKAADDKVAAADTAVASVVKSLKAAKLVDEKDDPAVVMAKLPDVLKKATTAATSADAQKAAEALEDAMKQLAAAQTEAKAAKADAETARDQAKKTAADAEKSLAQLKADARTAQDKLAEAQTAQRELLARAEKAERDAVAKAGQIETLHQQLTDARSGVAVPLSDRDVVAREQAAGMYGTAVELYFGGRYVAAEAALDRATKADPNDARYWYFLGLSRWMQGKAEAAGAFKKGAELEARGQPNRRLVTAALERVQGPARQVLAAYRP